MIPINDYAAFERRQAELLKRAEIEHLLREAKIDRVVTWGLPRRGAFWLGACLVRWGRNLERFGAPDHCQRATSISARSPSL